jgi:hypothetical protein
MDKFISACMLSMEDNALSRRVVYEWIEMFKNGCTSVTDADEESTRELILQNRRVTVDEIAKN